MQKVFALPGVIPQGKMATTPQWQWWVITHADGSHAGSVVEWSFGYMAYDATHFQLGNRASLQEATALILDPPPLMREFDAEITIPA